VLISARGISSSSSSDSSSELDSSSEELESDSDEGPFTNEDKPPVSPRRLADLSPVGFAVPLYLLTKIFLSFGGRVFDVDDNAGVNIPR
jgi:hypothetical protein